MVRSIADMKQKIKNPLLRRIPRELLGDWRKYLVVSLFLILTIGFVSGMYVACLLYTSCHTAWFGYNAVFI